VGWPSYVAKPKLSVAEKQGPIPTAPGNDTEQCSRHVLPLVFGSPLEGLTARVDPPSLRLPAGLTTRTSSEQITTVLGAEVFTEMEGMVKEVSHLGFPVQDV